MKALITDDDMAVRSLERVPIPTRAKYDPGSLDSVSVDGVMCPTLWPHDDREGYRYKTCIGGVWYAWGYARFYTISDALDRAYRLINVKG
jgi:hypothetical protein